MAKYFHFSTFECLSAPECKMRPNKKFKIIPYCVSSQKPISERKWGTILVAWGKPLYCCVHTELQKQNHTKLCKNKEFSKSFCGSYGSRLSATCAQLFLLFFTCKILLKGSLSIILGPPLATDFITCAPHRNLISEHGIDTAFQNLVSIPEV